MSKHFSFPLISALERLLDPILALPGPTACNLAPHSCAACKKCWRRCKPRCSRARFRASNQMLSENLTAAYPSVCSPLICCPIPSRLPSAQSGDPEGRPALALKLVPSNPEGPPNSAFRTVLRRTALQTAAGGFHLDFPVPPSSPSNKICSPPPPAAGLFFPVGMELPAGGLLATSRSTVSHSFLSGRCFSLPPEFAHEHTETATNKKQRPVEFYWGSG